MGITKDIAQFASGTSSNEIPKQALEVAALSLMDWFAVAIAGRDEPASRIVYRMVQEEGGVPDSSILGDATKYPVRAAALANGVASHALDYDDTHFSYVGHPSAVIIPAALALAEKARCTGQEFLDAVLIGSECACLIGTWLGRGHYLAGFHQTATAGCFGAALACARLLELDAQQTEHALGIASTRSAGIKSQFGTMGKPYNAGAAAASAVESAWLAGSGLTSTEDALECNQGFGATHAGENVELGDIAKSFKKSPVFESVQHEFHSCCHGIHASLEALAAILHDNALSTAAIKKIFVQVNPRWMKVCNLKKPETGLEAKFSFRLALAMRAVGMDTAAPSSFNDQVCQSDELISLRDKILVKPSAAHSDTAATVAIQVHSGAIHECYHDLAELPDFSTRSEKVQAKAVSLIGKDAAHKIREAIRSLPQTDIDKFVRHANCC